MGQVLLDRRLGPTIVVEHRPRLGVRHRHSQTLDTHAHSSGRRRARHGNECRDCNCKPNRQRGWPHTSYIGAATRENVLPKLQEALTSYNSDISQPTLDSRRSGLRVACVERVATSAESRPDPSELGELGPH